jgi:hypothetical protein
MSIAHDRPAQSWSLRLAGIALAAFTLAVIFETPRDYAPFVTLTWFDRAVDAWPALVVVALLLATVACGLLEFLRGYRKQGTAAILVAAALTGGIVAAYVRGYFG